MNTKHPIHIRETLSYLHEPEYAAVFARTYWRVLLTVGVSVVIVSALFSTRQTLLLSELTQVIPNTDNASLPFERTELENTIDALHKRDARYEQLRDNLPTIADPSR